jgi:asparagine synthase (glutamine-hydrolysing)
MCGITGYYHLGQQPIADTGTIIKMLQVQRHRGPDDSGIRAFSLKHGESAELDTNEPVYELNNFEGVLGFNRLSILDLSLNGHQPMASPDGKVILALNGEIYNAFDYTDELKSWGYRFKSTTDTEIVLALYLRYGFDEMLLRLNGMFAIVIIDLNLRKLLIARDRFGIKPMYYLVHNGILGFSSEIKSFKYIDGFEFRLDTDKLDEYLIFRNNLNGTLFTKIEALRPGYYLEYTLSGGVSAKQYFNIDSFSRQIDVCASLEEYSKDLEKWLGQSVRRQLMSDVKLGCQLSGGIDSSLVTWLANINSSKGNFESVSIVLENNSFNEEKYIDRVSDVIGIASHKFLLDSDYFIDNIERATWHLESPINHPNTLGIYKLSQCARQYVTVLLSGEGADEIFGGYERFYNIQYPYNRKKILDELFINLRQPVGILRYLDPQYRAIMATSYMHPATAKRLKSGFSFQNATQGRLSMYSSLSGTLFDRQVKYEILSYLPDLLIRQDKMSMAHSIENRVPFLDNELFSFSFSIPLEYLLVKTIAEGKDSEKYMLKKIAASVFGNEFAFRKKMGFGIPMKDFLSDKRFTEYVNDKIIPGIRGRGLFDHKLASSWVENIGSLGYQELLALWVIISFEIWASVYLK